MPALAAPHWSRLHLICILKGPDQRVPRIHWWKHPSLFLHKTHMELHVHRLCSSMKRRRARVSPPHCAEWSLPLPAPAPSIQDSSRRAAPGARSGAYHCGAGVAGAGPAAAHLLPAAARLPPQAPGPRRSRSGRDKLRFLSASAFTHSSAFSYPFVPSFIAMPRGLSQATHRCPWPLLVLDWSAQSASK